MTLIGREWKSLVQIAGHADDETFWGDGMDSRDVAFQAARLAEEILRAMETGSRVRLREGLDRACSLTCTLDSLSPRDAEQIEVLAAIAEQMRDRRGIPETHVRLLRHFAGTVRVCLS